MFRTTLLLSVVILLISCENNTIKIDGFLENKTKQTLTFGPIGNPLEQIDIDEQNHFKIETDQLSEGYYKIDNQLIFLSKGFDLQIKLTDSTISFAGNGAEENRILQEIISLEKDYKQFTPKFNKLVKLKPVLFKENLKNDINALSTKLNATGLNPVFVGTERKKASLFEKVALTEYADLYGTNFDLLEEIYKLYETDLSEEEISRKEDSIDKEVYKGRLPQQERFIIDSLAFASFSLNDSVLFSGGSSAYLNLLDRHLNFLISDKRNDDIQHPNEYYLKDIIVDSLQYVPMRNYYIYNVTQSIITNFPKYKNESLEYFNKHNSNAIYREGLKKLSRSSGLLSEGKKSPSFENYQNFSGGSSNLKDFLGSYVYIDIWATWCIPCIAEIPYLKELEEAYKNSPIKFISISVDQKKEYEKWKKMVATKELGGIQLIADNDFNSDFIKSYLIEAIPRFIFIDPQGNIISAEAPIPSSASEIKGLFNTYLAKKDTNL